MTVFAPFAADTDYFAADQTFLLNLRVTGLDAMAEALEAAGVRVERREEGTGTEYGTFASIHDPEGLPIELWEPQAVPVTGAGTGGTVPA
ncbi:MAG: hypothetical protein H7146_07320 [Burkholderiaceae bacterium]|nr:hypothetical protein [Microbacteriaceae bacterium]